MSSNVSSNCVFVWNICHDVWKIVIHAINFVCPFSSCYLIKFISSFQDFLIFLWFVLFVIVCKESNSSLLLDLLLFTIILAVKVVHTHYKMLTTLFVMYHWQNTLEKALYVDCLSILLPLWLIWLKASVLSEFLLHSVYLYYALLYVSVSYTCIHVRGMSFVEKEILM